MHLLDTSTLTLHEFFGDSTPHYAILSHRWEGAEVAFHDLGTDSGYETTTSFSKISGFCKQAAADGWKYAWVDSCCIDKSSSSELSEAINSMFQWYEEAQVCYVYLSDVSSELDWTCHQELGSEFRRSEWWTRGWTLQELLAPKDLVFYDCGWKEVGTKTSLDSLVSSITGISSYHLYNYRRASIAQKMSWAANRVTTRLEDQAYSLLGLFGVNLPPLYGEGPKSFQRLQLKILESSDDESLFAWTGNDSDPASGLLAESPASFATSGDIVRRNFSNRRPYSMTNKGLQIELTLIPNEIGTSYDFLDDFLAPLNCAYKSSNSPIALSLCTLPHLIHRQSVVFGMRISTDDNVSFQRSHNLFIIKNGDINGERTLVYVKHLERDRPPRPRLESLFCEIKTHLLELEQHGFHVVQEGWNKRSSNAEDVMQRQLLSDWRSFYGGQNLLIYKGWILYLKFAMGMPPYHDEPGNVGDSFVVVLEWPPALAFKKSILMVRLMITAEADSLAADIHQDRSRPENRRNGLDRTSKLLRSGRSVSVALKRRIEDGKQLLSLDITLDPEGKLPWPS